MRAYSSLIGHILGSHAQINGYFEMHLSYDQPASLDQQLAQYLESEQIKPNSHYLFDKLLHNNYTLDTCLFGDNLPRIIVTLRPPLQTIKSIVSLFRNKTEPHPYAEVDQAAQYYIQRLQWLDQFCRDDSPPFFYFDADIIRHQSQQLLTKLGNWLQLETPLSEHYEIFSRTGQAGAGDSSAQIQKGSIQHNHNNYESIDVPQPRIQAAEFIYHSVRKNLIRLAQQNIV